MERRKVALLFGLSLLVAGTIGAGLYYQHYFGVFIFGVWVAAEITLWHLRKDPRFAHEPSRSKNGDFDQLLKWFLNNEAESERLMDERIADLRHLGTLSEADSRLLSRLKDLKELRSLVFGESHSGRKKIRQIFAFAKDRSPRQLPAGTSAMPSRHEEAGVQEIMESATVVADLYWKLYYACLSEHMGFNRAARQLYENIFKSSFDAVSSRAIIEKLTDSMQRDGGLPFFIGRLIDVGQAAWARSITQALLVESAELEDDVRSIVYWLSEMHWFTHDHENLITDYETTIRYLYHLCFTSPARAGFLEIDSQFFSQFEVVNELAREGFLFKESLIERLLELWKDHEGYFDRVFQGIFEAMTDLKSKIYDERENWALFWRREHENFSRDYLYVVEGNLSFAAGHFDDARTYYEKALKLNPRLRPAQLNLVFCMAKLGNLEMLDLLVEKVVKDSELLPAALYVAGNAYLLVSQREKSDLYYQMLKGYEGWERKIDYYKSTFCFEHGLYELATEFARMAHEKNPSDSSVSYHLSLCYNAIGKKDQALDMVKKLDVMPQWLNYYRFTLERDAGRDVEASATLLQIPSDYFQDPDELEAALDFARHQKDLALLRHLRRKV